MCVGRTRQGVSVESDSELLFMFVESISHYCLSGQHSYTRVSLAHTVGFSSEFPISNTKLKTNHSESQCATVW